MDTSLLMYGSETWTLTQQNMYKIKTTEILVLRKITPIAVNIVFLKMSVYNSCCFLKNPINTYYTIKKYKTYMPLDNLKLKIFRVYCLVYKPVFKAKPKD